MSLDRRSFLGSLVAALGIAKVATPADVRPPLPGGQPRPIQTLACRVPVGFATVTAIYRRWANGDEKRCRLCDQCTAQGDGCLLTVGQLVPVGQTAMYDASGGTHKVVTLKTQNQQA